MQKRKQLEEQKKEEDLSKLIKTMEMTGIDINEVQELIRSAARTKLENEDKNNNKRLKHFKALKGYRYVKLQPYPFYF